MFYRIQEARKSEPFLFISSIMLSEINFYNPYMDHKP